VKKLLAFLCALSMLFSLSACDELLASPGISDKAIIGVGDSVRFSDAEIRAAMDCVKQEFAGFRGCELKKLWYDEAASDQEISYAAMLPDDTLPENVIVLMSELYAGKYGGASGFEADSTCSNWAWTLTRENNSAEWKVLDWGV